MIVCGNKKNALCARSRLESVICNRERVRWSKSATAYSTFDYDLRALTVNVCSCDVSFLLLYIDYIRQYFRAMANCECAYVYCSCICRAHIQFLAIVTDIDVRFVVEMERQSQPFIRNQTIIETFK